MILRCVGLKASAGNLRIHRFKMSDLLSLMIDGSCIQILLVGAVESRFSVGLVDCE